MAPLRLQALLLVATLAAVSLAQEDIIVTTPLPILSPPEGSAFGPEEYQLTNPEAAAASIVTAIEVVLADAEGQLTAQSTTAPVDLSAEELEGLKAYAAAHGPVISRCNTTSPTRAQFRRTERLIAANARRREQIGIAAVTVPNIGVWVHALRYGTLATQGNIPDAWITKQISVLNTAFAGNFKFTLLGTVRYDANPAWNNMDIGLAAERAMKQQLRRGTATTLNLYTNKLCCGLLGWATFPDMSTKAPGSLGMDGVIVDFGTLPDGPLAPYNLGHTATHEIGHWLNLLHTFESFGVLNGGCTRGDSVTDTPAEASPADGCPVGRDTCPTLAGQDPIRNYMDYSADACFTNFSPGQYTRMRAAWNNVRVPQCKSVASAGGACGKRSTGNICCPTGQCCGANNVCGTSATACGTGCQRAYGYCNP